VAYGIIGGHMPEPEPRPGAFFEWGAAGAVWAISGFRRRNP
jgi:hypothetical protein